MEKSALPTLLKKWKSVLAPESANAFRTIGIGASRKYFVRCANLRMNRISVRISVVELIPPTALEVASTQCCALKRSASEAVKFPTKTDSARPASISKGWRPEKGKPFPLSGSIVPVTGQHYQRAIDNLERDRNSIVCKGLDEISAVRAKVRFRLLIEMKFHNI